MLIREVTERSLADYVREQISTGYTALSQVVSSRIDIGAGRLFVISPEAFAPERIENWNWDPGHIKWRVADDLLARLIHDHLQNPHNRVLIQDFELRRSDPCFKDDPLRVLYGEEPYWELCGRDISEQKIQECIGDASYWPWLAYFCKAREGQNRLITGDDLEEVATQLVGVAVQALHDSYAIWWRTALEPFITHGSS